MIGTEPFKSRRVLIASSHPLFGQGLNRLLQEKRSLGVEVVGMVSNLEQALDALHRLEPDLIIVDYDDEKLNRDEFLARFVEGEKKLRVVLLSLQSAKDALVYDRRTLAASQIDDWLKEWSLTNPLPIKSSRRLRTNSKAENRRSPMRHLIIAGLLVVVVTVLLILGLGQIRMLPVEASLQAQPIDRLFNLEFKVIAFLFALIVVFMVYSIVVFRRKRGDTTDGPHMTGNKQLEITWTLAPLATVLVFAYLGGNALAETMRADPKALEIKVIAQQWSWRFEYPDYGIVSDVLMMPVNKQAILELSSNDVVHSFWVPEFRVKQDALPGGQEFIRDLRITPSMVGDFKVRCAELCGRQHATMVAPVKVVVEADFQDWVIQQTGASNDPVVRGQKLAQQYGCLACHSIDGSKLVGPSWKGVFGSQVSLADGSTVTADEAYIRESILDPTAKVVQGFPGNVMPPTYRSQLSDAQIADLIAFIKSLQ
jgi:cytochrome c oxidase subunit 2